jgi:hypothetical protein
MRQTRAAVLALAIAAILGIALAACGSSSHPTSSSSATAKQSAVPSPSASSTPDYTSWVSDLQVGFGGSSQDPGYKCLSFRVTNHGTVTANISVAIKTFNAAGVRMGDMTAEADTLGPNETKLVSGDNGDPVCAEGLVSAQVLDVDVMRV